MLYLDTSALVKKYVQEPRSDEVREAISRHESVATSTITRAEAAATFARAARDGSLNEADAKAAHRQFLREWKSYARICITESIIAKADDIAWTFRLRGYDAVHLACAIEWHHRVEKNGECDLAPRSAFSFFRVR
jgi:uncharacterized protein